MNVSRLWIGVVGLWWLTGCQAPNKAVTPVADSSAQTARRAQTWMRKPDHWQLNQMWFGNSINPQRTLIYQRGQPRAGVTTPSLDWMRLKSDNQAEFKYNWSTQATEFLYKVDDAANQLVLYQANIFDPLKATETWYVKPGSVYNRTFEMQITSPGDSYTLTFSAVP